MGNRRRLILPTIVTLVAALLGVVTSGLDDDQQQPARHSTDIERGGVPAADESQDPPSSPTTDTGWHHHLDVTILGGNHDDGSIEGSERHDGVRATVIRDHQLSVVTDLGADVHLGWHHHITGCPFVTGLASC